MWHIKEKEIKLIMISRIICKWTI